MNCQPAGLNRPTIGLNSRTNSVTLREPNALGKDQLPGSRIVAVPIRPTSKRFDACAMLLGLNHADLPAEGFLPVPAPALLPLVHLPSPFRALPLFQLRA
jgi:hypothetical protein